MRWTFGDFEFDSHQLRRRGAIVAMTPKAALLLGALISAAPSPMSKERLYKRLWPGVNVEDGNLHNLVSELRGVLSDEAKEIIVTVHRRGYAFAAPLQAARGSHLEIGHEAIALRDGENIIGREMFGTPDVSRHHARIDVDGPHVWIEDLGSKNGTFVNGQRIRKRIALKEGDQIVFGRSRAIVRMLDGGSPTITITGSRE